MNSSGVAPVFEAHFDMSDYVNFDFNFEAPHQTLDNGSSISVAEPLQNMSIDNTYACLADAADTDFAGLFQLPNGSNAFGNEINATPVASEDLGNVNGFRTPVTIPTSIQGLPALTLGPEDLGMMDAFDSPIDIDATLGDSVALNSDSEDASMTDAFQTTVETDSLLDSFTVFKPTAFAHGIDQAVLEIPRSPSRLLPIPMQGNASPQSSFPSPIVREPSRWVLASPELQQHLNSVFAAQVIANSGKANPAPVLYFPAEQRLGFPANIIASLPSVIRTHSELPKTSQPSTETRSIDPSLLMQGSGEWTPHQPFPNGIYSPISSITPADAPNAEDLALALIKKRALDANKSDSDSVSKRLKLALAEPFPGVAKDDDSDDDDEPVTTRKRTARQNTVPIIAKDDESDEMSEDESEDESKEDPDDESEKSDSSGFSPAPPATILPPAPVARRNPSAIPSSKPTAKKSPNWRYEQQQESRIRDQRRKEWIRRRVNPPSAKGKASNCKIQKLVEEIQDTEGFAEAQGYEIGESVGMDSVSGRPVRKGAKKSYVGQG